MHRAFTNNDNWFYAPLVEYGLQSEHKATEYKMIEVTAHVKGW